MIKSSTTAAAESGKKPAIPPTVTPVLDVTPDPVRVLRQQAQEKFGPLGHTIAEAYPAAVLHSVSGATFGDANNVGGFKAFLDSVLEAAGNPSDPVEAMLVQQLVWAHHQIGNLMGKAAHPNTVQEADVYNSALARVMAEFRRGSLALREYRAGPSSTRITVVKQQNLAMVNGHLTENDSDIELSTNHARLNHVEYRDNAFSSADCSAFESIEAKKPIGRKSRETPAGGLSEPTLEARNGSENGRG